MRGEGLVMAFISLFKGDTVGLPMTPSVWTSKPKYKEVTLIKMSAGGGMGGTLWNELVEKTEVKEGLEKYKRVLIGETITLNSRFIVSVINYSLMTVSYYTTNSNFSEGHHTTKLLLPKGNKISLSDEYMSAEKRNGFIDIGTIAE